MYLVAVPGGPLHVELTDGVLQASLHAALGDGLGDGVHVELGHFQVILRFLPAHRHGAVRFPIIHHVAGGDEHPFRTQPYVF